MSFISILKSVGRTVLNIEHAAAPIAEVFLPQFAGIITQVDGLFGRLQAAIVTAETNPPVVSGKVKASNVVADFEAGLAVALAAVGLTGHKVQYDDAALQSAIAAQVTAYNAMAAVKASFRVVPAPAK